MTISPELTVRCPDCQGPTIPHATDQEGNRVEYHCVMTPAHRMVVATARESSAQDTIYESLLRAAIPRVPAWLRMEPVSYPLAEVELPAYSDHIRQAFFSILDALTREVRDRLSLYYDTESPEDIPDSEIAQTTQAVIREHRRRQLGIRDTGHRFTPDLRPPTGPMGRYYEALRDAEGDPYIFVDGFVERHRRRADAIAQELQVNEEYLRPMDNITMATPLNYPRLRTMMQHYIDRFMGRERNDDGEDT